MTMNVLAKIGLLLGLFGLGAAPVLAAQHTTGSYSGGNGQSLESVCVTWSGTTLGSGTIIPCANGTGGGGGGGGAVTAASGAYAAGSIVDLGTGTSPAANTVNARLEAIRALLAGTLTIANPTGAATSALQTAGNTSLTTIATGVGAPGDTAYAGSGNSSVIAALKGIYTATTGPIPAGSATIGNTGGLETSGAAATGGGSRMMGKDGTGNAQDIKTSSNGGLLPGQSVPTSTQVTTTASTSTLLSAANTARTAYEFEIETTLTANLYICLKNQTCSATVHDIMLASGTTAGFRYPALFGVATEVNYFTTQASVVINSTDWAAQ